MPEVRRLMGASPVTVRADKATSEMSDSQIRSLLLIPVGGIRPCKPLPKEVDTMSDGNMHVIT